MFRKVLRGLGRIWGLTRGVGIFIVGNLVVGLDAFSGACLENLPQTVAIVPVTTFDGLAASLASLVILAYLKSSSCTCCTRKKAVRKYFEAVRKVKFSTHWS